MRVSVKVTRDSGAPGTVALSQRRIGRRRSTTACSQAAKTSRCGIPAREWGPVGSGFLASPGAGLSPPRIFFLNSGAVLLIDFGGPHVGNC